MLSQPVLHMISMALAFMCCLYLAIPQQNKYYLKIHLPNDSIASVNRAYRIVPEPVVQIWVPELGVGVHRCRHRGGVAAAVVAVAAAAVA